jgi:hypothetical protein
VGTDVNGMTLLDHGVSRPMQSYHGVSVLAHPPKDHGRPAGQSKGRGGGQKGGAGERGLAQRCPRPPRSRAMLHAIPRMRKMKRVSKGGQRKGVD